MELKDLKVIRDDQGLSLEEVALRSGLNRVTISVIEKGLGSPAWSSVEKVVLALGYELKLEAGNGG